MNNFKDYLNFSPNLADNAYRIRQLALQEALLAEAKKKKKEEEKKKSKGKDKKAAKDYDGDGKIESGKKEYFGSRDKAIKANIEKKKQQNENVNLSDLELVEELMESVFDFEDLDLLESLIVEKKKWIQDAIKKEGSLRKTLKAKEGKNIPVSKLEKAAKQGGKTGKRARLALTLRKLNEAAFNIPATVGEQDMGDPSQVGIDEFEKIMKAGGHPIMSGQGQGNRGVPPEIRSQALEHIRILKSHPKGKVDNYSKDHPIFKQGMAAHQFFKTHFPEFGVEDQIAGDYNLFEM